jgi:hypothetical protein
MANISVWHWVILMVINLIWFVLLTLEIAVRPEQSHFFASLGEYFELTFGRIGAPQHGLPDDHICLFSVDCSAGDGAHRRQLGGGGAVPEGCGEDAVDARRRQLAGGEDACPCMNSTAPVVVDICPNETLNWIWVYIVIGWLVVIGQVTIVWLINSKMNMVRLVPISSALFAADFWLICVGPCRS